MRAITASIVHDDAYTAGRETATELLDRLGQTPDVVLVFASAAHDPAAVLEGMWSRLPASVRLLGCTSFAEIGDDGAVVESVTAMALSFDTVQWQVYRVDPIDGTSADAGRMLAEQMVDFDPSLVITLPDGLRLNSTKFVAAMQEVLGRRPVIGGLSADDLSFDRTAELFDRDVLRGGAVALALRGPIVFASSAMAGFQPVGVTRTCTRVEHDKRIVELDGHPALDLYREFLGPDVAERPNIGTEFPLAMVESPNADYMASDERFQVIRAVRELDAKRGSLACGGDVYEGAKVRMTRGTKDDLIAAAVEATAQARRAVPNPVVGLFFNCAGRKLVLGARYPAEVRAAFDALGPDVAKIGFYTFGEIAPVAGANMYHDETFTLALLGTR